MLGLFAQKKAPGQPSAIDLERQRKVLIMQNALEEIREKIEVNSQKAIQMETQVKNLICEKKKDEAKKQLRVLKAIYEELAPQEHLCIILEKEKIKSEYASDRCGLSLEISRTLQKEAEEDRKPIEDFLVKNKEVLGDFLMKNREFFEDFLMKSRESFEELLKEREIDKFLGEIADNDKEEEIEEMCREFEQEVLNEKMEPQVPILTTQTTQMEEMSIDDSLKEAALYS